MPELTCDCCDREFPTAEALREHIDYQKHDPCPPCKKQETCAGPCRKYTQWVEAEPKVAE